MSATISPSFHAPMPCSLLRVMLREWISPNSRGASDISLPLSRPVVGSLWHSAHSRLASFLPRATRSGVTSTCTSTTGCRKCGMPSIAHQATNPPAATTTAATKKTSAFNTFFIRTALSTRRYE